jgi:methylmalonyl-CoA/ethylmalonyl-CoA epimerase
MLTRIDHVGIVVADIDSAIALYVGTLGARLVARQHQPVFDIEECMLALDESTPGSGTYIQLLEPRGDSEFRDFLLAHGGGLHHVAYAVEDIDTARRTLIARGLQPTHDTYRAGTMGAQVFFLNPEDAHGVRIEITQPGTGWGSL